MKTKRSILTVFIFVVLSSSLIFLPACKKGEKVFRVGVIGPLTGEGADYGMDMKRGVELAIEEINAEGGLNGVKVKAIYEDSQFNPKMAINALNKLVQEDGVFVIIGAAASGVSLSIAPLANSNKVVLFSSISSSDDLKEAGDYFFRDVPPNKAQAETAAKYIFNILNKKNTFIFKKNNDYGKNLAKSFRESFEALGGTIVGEEAYNPQQKDFRNDMNKIKALQPEVIYFPGNYEESGIILRQAKEMDMDAIFFGGDGSFKDGLLKLADEAANGSFYTMMGVPEKIEGKPNELFAKFKEKFNQKYGTTEVNANATYTYDAAKCIFEALKKGANSGESLMKELKKIKYMGVTGPIEFDEFNEVNKMYSIYTVENVKFVFVE